MQNVDICREMNRKEIKAKKHARFGRCPGHAGLCLAFHGLVQEDGKQRMRKWVSPGQSHLGSSQVQPGGSEKAAEISSAYRAMSKC